MATAKLRITDYLAGLLDWQPRLRSRVKTIGQRGQEAPAAQAEPAAIAATTEAEAPASRQRSQQQLHETVEAIRQQMADEADRSERLIQAVEQLPEAVQALPEATAKQLPVLQAIEQQLAQQAEAQQSLYSAVDGLVKRTESQHRHITAIKQKLDQREEHEQQMLSQFGRVADTLAELHASSQDSAASLREMADRNDQRDAEVQYLFHRSRREMVAFSAVSWFLAAMALAVAGFVAFSMMQLSPAQASAEPTAGVQAAEAEAGSVPPAEAGSGAAEAVYGNVLDDGSPGAETTGSGSQSSQSDEAAGEPVSSRSLGQDLAKLIGAAAPFPTFGQFAPVTPSLDSKYAKAR